MYKQNGKTFSFMQINQDKQTHIAQETPSYILPSINIQASPLYHPKTTVNSHHQSTKIDPSSFSQFVLVINASINNIKSMTVAFVQSLSKFSLGKHIQLQIQNYLTKILDEIDLISQRQNYKHSYVDHDINNFISESRQFQQLDKPKGDDQFPHIEETIRNTLKNPLKLIDQGQKNNLNEKLQLILRQIEVQNSNSHNIPDINKQNKDDEVICPKVHSQQELHSSNRFKAQSKAHKFSSLYMRESHKNKRIQFY